MLHYKYELDCCISKLRLMKSIWKLPDLYYPLPWKGEPQTAPSPRDVSSLKHGLVERGWEVVNEYKLNRKRSRDLLEDIPVLELSPPAMAPPPAKTGRVLSSYKGS